MTSSGSEVLVGAASPIALQAKYLVRLTYELPVRYVQWVILGCDPLRRQMFWERLGVLPRPPGQSGRRVIIDANGHGEYNQIHTFLKLFRSRYRDWTIILISWNPEIVELASRNPDVDLACFAPWDVAWVARRYLRALNPRLLICVDQIRFPLLLQASRRLGIRTILVSACLPEVYIGSVHLKKALAFRYYRYLDQICVADEEDRRNYVRIGCDERTVKITGYMKFDLEFLRTSDEESAAFRRALGIGMNEVVWVAGSVRRGEESLVAEAFGKLRESFPNLRLIIAPRYVTDVREVCRVLDAKGFKHVLRTQIVGTLPPDAIVVLDTYGELSKLYAVADVVFIGNSLLSGDEYALGQNLVEPLAHGKPVLFGPFMNKWKVLTRELKEAWSGLEVRCGEELAVSIEQLLGSCDIRQKVERKIQDILERNRPAVQNNFAAVVKLMELDKSRAC